MRPFSIRTIVLAVLALVVVVWFLLRMRGDDATAVFGRTARGAALASAGEHFRLSPLIGPELIKKINDNGLTLPQALMMARREDSAAQAKYLPLGVVERTTDGRFIVHVRRLTTQGAEDIYVEWTRTDGNWTASDVRDTVARPGASP